MPQAPRVMMSPGGPRDRLPGPLAAPHLPSVLGLSSLWVTPLEPCTCLLPIALSCSVCGPPPPTLSHLPQLLFSGWILGPHLSSPRPARCPICPVFGLHPPALLTQMWHDSVGSEGRGQSHWGSCRHGWGWGGSGLTGSSLVHGSPVTASDGFAPGVGPL